MVETSGLTLDLHKIEEWRGAPETKTRFTALAAGGTLIAATLYNLLVAVRPNAPSSAEIWFNVAAIAALGASTIGIALFGLQRHLFSWAITVAIMLAFILGCIVNNFLEGGATTRVLLWLPWLIVLYVQNAGVLRPPVALAASSAVFLLSLAALAPYVVYRDLHVGVPDFDVLVIASLLQLTMIVMLYNIAIRREAHLAALARAEAERDAAKERARIEAELAAARLELAYINRSLTISALAASIAHEIKQPLSAIITSGTASINWLARAEPAVHEAQLLNERIIKDASRASEIVISMRDLLKRGDQVRAPLDARSLIDDIFSIMRSEAAAHGSDLTVSYGPDLPLVAADRVQLQQVIINLVLNALEASLTRPAGERPIHIAVRRGDGGALIISVEDRGEGIGAAAAARIFDPFFTTKPAGMGLGLSICRTIVQAHNGEIAAVPLEKGTMMRLTLPASG